MSDATLTPPVGEHDHATGPAGAPVTLVEYGDFECPYCGQAYPIVKAIQERMGDRLRFVFRNFPISESHPHAEHAAETAEAAGAQGAFWEMHDMLYEHQAALSDRDLISYAADLGLDEARVARELGQGTFAAKVRGDFRGGVRSGVNGTPTFFIDGVRYDGSWTDAAEFLRALQAAMR